MIDPADATDIERATSLGLHDVESRSAVTSPEKLLRVRSVRLKLPLT